MPWRILFWEQQFRKLCAGQPPSPYIWEDIVLNLNWNFRVPFLLARAIVLSWEAVMLYAHASSRGLYSGLAC